MPKNENPIQNEEPMVRNQSNSETVSMRNAIIKYFNLLRIKQKYFIYLYDEETRVLKVVNSPIKDKPSQELFLRKKSKNCSPFIVGMEDKLIRFSGKDTINDIDEEKSTLVRDLPNLHARGNTTHLCLLSDKMTFDSLGLDGMKKNIKLGFLPPNAIDSHGFSVQDYKVNMMGYDDDSTKALYFENGELVDKIDKQSCKLYKWVFDTQSVEQITDFSTIDKDSVIYLKSPHDVQIKMVKYDNHKNQFIAVNKKENEEVMYDVDDILYQNLSKTLSYIKSNDKYKAFLSLALNMSDLLSKKEENTTQINETPSKKEENTAQINEMPSKKEENTAQINEMPSKKEENTAQINEMPNKKEENTTQVNKKDMGLIEENSAEFFKKIRDAIFDVFSMCPEAQAVVKDQYLKGDVIKNTDGAFFFNEGNFIGYHDFKAYKPYIFDFKKQNLVAVEDLSSLDKDVTIYLKKSEEDKYMYPVKYDINRGVAFTENDTIDFVSCEKYLEDMLVETKNFIHSVDKYKNLYQKTCEQYDDELLFDKSDNGLCGKHEILEYDRKILTRTIEQNPDIEAEFYKYKSKENCKAKNKQISKKPKMLNAFVTLKPVKSDKTAQKAQEVHIGNSQNAKSSHDKGDDNKGKNREI